MLGTHYVVRSSNGVLSGIGESSRLTFPSAVASFLELGPIDRDVGSTKRTNKPGLRVAHWRANRYILPCNSVQDEQVYRGVSAMQQGDVWSDC